MRKELFALLVIGTFLAYADDRPTTVPSPTSQPDIERLKRRVADAENALLSARNELKGALEKSGLRLPPKSTFKSRREGRTKMLSIIQRGAAIDAHIQDYLKKNVPPPEIESAIWAGKPMVGMTSEELGLIATLKITFESERTKSFRITPFETEDFAEPPEVYVDLRDGKVVSISYPRRAME